MQYTYQPANIGVALVLRGRRNAPCAGIPATLGSASAGEGGRFAVVQDDVARRCVQVVTPLGDTSDTLAWRVMPTSRMVLASASLFE